MSIRLGIIGAGRIAKRAVAELLYVEDIELTAVYNPNFEHAKDFAEWADDDKYNKLYDSITDERNNFDTQNQSPEEKQRKIQPVESLDELSNMVDAVYIASPHGTHAEYAQRMLQSGKHVICEKPMSFNKEEADKLFEIAEEKRLVLMEGIKTAYCPGFIKLEEVVKSGIIGDIVDVEAVFTRLTEPGCREYTDLKFGGAFTEFGTYTMLPIFRFLETDYSEVSFNCISAYSGVDGYIKADFIYKKSASEKGNNEVSLNNNYGGNKIATSKCGLTVKSEGQLVISGTKGYILAPSPWWLTRSFEVRFEDPKHIERYSCVFEGDGLRYEFREFVKRIKEEKIFFMFEKDEAIARAATYELWLKNRAI